jgi:hypothetical protein
MPVIGSGAEPIPKAYFVKAGTMVNFDRANHWLVLCANFAVIAGIGFLAVELRQNTQQLEIQSYQSWVAASQGHPNSADLTSETYIAYAMFHMSMFQMAQSTHYLYIEGSLNKELWESEMDRAAGILSIPGVRQWWDAGGKTQLTPSFVEFLESREPNVTLWHWDEDRGYTSVDSFSGLKDWNQ